MSPTPPPSLSPLSPYRRCPGTPGSFTSSKDAKPTLRRNFPEVYDGMTDYYVHFFVRTCQLLERRRSR